MRICPTCGDMVAATLRCCPRCAGPLPEPRTGEPAYPGTPEYPGESGYTGGPGYLPAPYLAEPDYPAEPRISRGARVPSCSLSGGARVRRGA